MSTATESVVTKKISVRGRTTKERKGWVKTLPKGGLCKLVDINRSKCKLSGLCAFSDMAKFDVVPFSCDKASNAMVQSYGCGIKMYAVLTVD